jgi:hypothetical protein
VGGFLSLDVATIQEAFNGTLLTSITGRDADLSLHTSILRSLLSRTEGFFVHLRLRGDFSMRYASYVEPDRDQLPGEPRFIAQGLSC